MHQYFTFALRMKYNVENVIVAAKLSLDEHVSCQKLKSELETDLKVKFEKTTTTTEAVIFGASIRVQLQAKLLFQMQFPVTY